MRDSWFVSEKFQNLDFQRRLSTKWTDAFLLIGIDPLNYPRMRDLPKFTI